jgi:hypothetical protein
MRRCAPPWAFTSSTPGPLAGWTASNPSRPGKVAHAVEAKIAPSIRTAKAEHAHLKLLMTIYNDPTLAK